MISNLLEVSKLDNSDYHIDKNEIDLVDILKSAIRSLTPLSKEKHIDIQFESHHHNYLFYGDSFILKELLRIIFHSALKFSPDQSKIDITFMGDEIKIRDYGIGLSQEVQRNLFKKLVPSEKGTGLGLFIANLIAQRHQINIQLESSLQKGTTVTLQLPHKKETE